MSSYGQYSGAGRALFPDDDIRATKTVRTGLSPSEYAKAFSSVPVLRSETVQSVQSSSEELPVQRVVQRSSPVQRAAPPPPPQVQRAAPPPPPPERGYSDYPPPPERGYSDYPVDVTYPSVSSTLRDYTESTKPLERPLPTYDDLGIDKQFPRARDDQTPGETYATQTKLPTYKDLGIDKVIPVQQGNWTRSPRSSETRVIPAQRATQRAAPPPPPVVQRAPPPPPVVQRAAAPPPPPPQQYLASSSSFRSTTTGPTIQAAMYEPKQYPPTDFLQAPTEVVGLGMLLEGMDDGRRYVKELVPGMGADVSREIQVGDEILQIDGTSVEGLHLDRIKALSVNNVGTVATLKLVRNGSGVRDVRVTRVGGNRIRPSEYQQIYNQSRGSYVSAPETRTAPQSAPMMRAAPPPPQQTRAAPPPPPSYQPTITERMVDVDDYRPSRYAPASSGSFRGTTGSFRGTTQGYNTYGSQPGMRKVIRVDGTETWEDAAKSSPSLYGSERAVRPATQDSYYSNYSNNNLASRGLYGSMPARGEAAPIQAMY